jgi:hypothetical protein
MSIWLRALVLSFSGIVVAIGGLGGFDAHHFPEYFKIVGSLVVIFGGIPIVALTIGMIVLEKILEKYGRYVMTLLCAAPGLYLWVLFLVDGGGDASYVFAVVACCFGWAALWFITAPRPIS